MIALYIIAGIVLLVFIVLMLRVRISVDYKKVPDSDGYGSVFIALGPFRKQHFPEKKEKLKLSDFSAKKYRKKLEDDSKKKAMPPKPKKEEDDLSSSEIKQTLSLIGDLLSKFAGFIRCDLLRLRLSIGTSDAAVTALAYPAISYAVETVLDLIAQYTDMRLIHPNDVYVHADFENREITADISAKFSIRIIGIIKGVVRSEINSSKQAARRKAAAQNKHKYNSAPVRKNGDKS